MKIEEYRNRFPIIKRGMNYQATCGIGILPDVGVQAIEDVKGTSTEIPEVNFDNFLNAHEELKAEFAKIINAEPGEIALVQSTSAAACRILNSLDYEKRNKIVVSALSFPGISFACHAQQKRGAKISFVPSPQKIGSPVDYDNLRPEPTDYEKSIDEKTILVVLTGTCYRTGFRQDKLREIVKIAHDKGAYVFIDDGQLSGHFVEDVKGSNVDFLASTTYKYLLCPTGNAFLYVKEKMERLGHHFPNDHRVHQTVIDILMDRGDTTMGSRLDRLLEKRRFADYYMDKSLSIGEGNYCTGISEWIINTAEQLSPKKK